MGSLAFLVPARPGFRVGALGASAALLEDLAAAGADARVAGGTDGGGPPGAADAPGGLPFSDDSLDGLVVPEPRTGLRELVAEAERVLHPGGALVIGVGNAHGVQRWRAAGRRARSASPPALSLGRARRLLEQGGFADIAAYGALESLQRPRFLVSLDTAQVARYFFRSLYEPHSRAAAFTALALPLIDGLGAYHILFPGLVFCARRTARGGGERA